MNFRKTAVLLFFGLLACDHPEAVYPQVSTSDVQQLGQTSVVLEAEILEAGSVRPIRYGFLWDSVAGLNIISATHRIDLGSADGKKTYSIKLDSLSPNKTYYARAYTSSPDYSKFYYGNEISFKTLP